MTDPHDDMVFETAVNGGAHVLVTAKEAKRLAVHEGVALNQLIHVAVAEKLSALRTESFFKERASRAVVSRAREILRKAGQNNDPEPGDEL